MGQYSESCNGRLGKIYLLAIFLGLQTVILIATVPARTGKKRAHWLHFSTAKGALQVQVPGVLDVYLYLHLFVCLYFNYTLSSSIHVQKIKINDFLIIQFNLI